MVSNESAILGRLFPDAYYHTKGLRAGQWEIPGYYLNFQVGFYTNSDTFETTFIKTDWEATLTELKSIGQPIVKGNGLNGYYLSHLD